MGKVEKTGLELTIWECMRAASWSPSARHMYRQVSPKTRALHRTQCIVAQQTPRHNTS